MINSNLETMKQLKFIIAFLAITNFANAQVSIGGKQLVEGNSTILDFNSTFEGKKATDATANNTFGIILPSVASEPVITIQNQDVQSANNGTFVFDKSTKKVKMFENNKWRDLSETGSDSRIVSNNSDDTSQNQGAIIGSATSSAKGVLVLESADKAMILPRIDKPHTSVKNPYAGMMCFDTASKTLAVFDGTNWNYWK